MTAAIAGTTPWNGPPVTLGARVYLANGGNDTVRCYDFATAATCPNFPKATTGAGYIYTVNADPQRPDCLWVNADFGSSQIQNFDAYTGGACGGGAIRVLASSLVAPTQTCVPDRYTALKVLSPGRGSYTDGTVTFLDGNGQPIPGMSDRPLDVTGSVDLRDLDFTSDTGLPQFLIELNGASGDPTAVTVELSWTGDDDTSCQPQSSVVVQPKHALTDQVFTASYACSNPPTLVFTRPDGSAAPGLTVGDQTSTDDLNYTRTVSMSTPGRLVARVTCNGNDATSAVFDSVVPVPGTFGPGWPQDLDGHVPLVYNYLGGQRYGPHVTAAAGAWNAVGSQVSLTLWPGDATPVDITVADINIGDDLWGVTMNSDPDSNLTSGFERLLIYMNQRTLDPETGSTKTKVSTHEFGHALDLRHPGDVGLERDTGPTSVMWQGRLPYNTPQDYDTTRLDQRYP